MAFFHRDSSASAIAAPVNCQLALLELTDKLFKAKNSKLFTSIIALDYTRAIDTVNNAVLLKRLEAFNFSSLSGDFRDIYPDVLILFGGQLSDSMAVTCGIPQGSILGPILFVIYLNDLLLQLPSECTLTI
jgi:hypothetical protein